MTAPSLMAAATDPIVPSGSNAQLILAAIGGIAVIVLLITWLKLHAFLALMIGAIGVGIAAGLGAIPSASCSPTPAAPRRSSTPSSTGPVRARCPG